MYSPFAVKTKPEITAAVSEVERLMAPDVVHIRYDLRDDWSGDPAVFFRVLLSDEASEQRRLHEIARRVERNLESLLDFSAMGYFAYYNFRTASEQAVLREETWA